MLKYRLIPAPEWRQVSSEEAFVFLPITDLDEAAAIGYQGSERLVREIQFKLIGSYGERGRVIEEVTTGYDLHNAMNQWIMAEFEPELVEGQSLFPQG